MKLSRVPQIAALQREIGPGKCCFCEDSLPPYAGFGQHSVHCGGEDCARSYHRIYRERRTELNWAKGLTSKGDPAGNDPRIGKRRQEQAL